MNITGITTTAPVLPQQQTQAAEPQVQSTDQVQVTQADSIALSVQVSTQVMDMAQQQFESAANELISSMSAAVGVGSNVDVSV